MRGPATCERASSIARPAEGRVLERLGRHRWQVECTMAWPAGCRRLHRRYERKAEHFLAFACIACALICYRELTT